MYGYYMTGETEWMRRTAAEIGQLAGGDPHLGADHCGFSPVLGIDHCLGNVLAFEGRPEDGLRSLRSVRGPMFESGYQEMALWTMGEEGLIRFNTGRAAGVDAIATEAQRLAREQGNTFNEIVATCNVYCSALALNERWQELIAATADVRQKMHDTRTTLVYETCAIDLHAVGLLAIGDVEGARRSAQEAVDLMESKGIGNRPGAYKRLALSQLELGEHADAIEETLARFRALIEKTGAVLFDGDVCVLEGLLARRSGRTARAEERFERALGLYQDRGCPALAEELRRRLS